MQKFDFDLFYNKQKAKYNDSVVLTPEDKAAGVKILCKESYAQDLYELYASAGLFKQRKPTKDFELDSINTVVFKNFDRRERLVHAEESFSKSSIFIPARELNLAPGDNEVEVIQDAIALGTPTKVMIYRKENGEIYASEKKCAALIFRQDLEDSIKTNSSFTVKIVELIDGGYIALYKNAIRCFLPGSQAAANVIHDFTTLLGQEIPVMIENYDAFNNLYIVSYKKYIKNTISQRVHELRFGKKYTGILTNRPYDFGVFVEWDNYFTGMVHRTDFEDYQSVLNTMKSGDKLEVYVKDITSKKGETRIILTTNKQFINETKLAWQDLKDEAEGKVLDYNVDKDRGQLEVILPNDTVTYITVDLNKVKHLTRRYAQIKIHRIDTVKQFVKFDFV